MEGCEVVFHTASPFLLRFDDPQAELVEPALKGTQNVLNSVNATPSVRRVVLTSSCAAVYGDNADIRSVKGPQFTEADWNTTSTLHHKPYSLSKTLAERAAWEMAAAQNRWDLVTINPSLVLGPGIGSHTSSGSFELIRNIGDGTLKAGVPCYPFGAVDVREVAQAHLKAGLDHSVVSGRYILSGHNTDLPGLAAILRSQFGDAYPFPKRTLPKWITWLFGPLVDKSMTRRLVARNVGVPAGFDNSRSRRELGIVYRPLQESLAEMFQQLVDAGIVRC
jgi:dihydroflavonol-4-reductase